MPMFDPAAYLTGASRRNARWRVDFNGLGDLAFCPVVRKTDVVLQGLQHDVLAHAKAFAAAISPQMLERALSWAYLSETEGSFAIERETPPQDKAALFVGLLQRAHDRQPLTEDYLVALQNAAVTNPLDRAVQFRTEQNRLQDSRLGAAGVTYVPPPPELAAELMAHLMALANQRPAPLDALAHAALVSFAFVFIHPFMDGNGRLSRFVFHQALCNSGRLAKGFLLPVSVAMKRHEADYLAALQSFSRPARERVQVTWIDEGEYRFRFVAGDAIFRYWDATACAEFGFRMAAQALDVELKQETRFLSRYDEVVRRVNERADLRGSDLGTLAMICLDNDGTISHRKRKRFADRVPEGVFDLIESTVRDVLAATP